MTEIFSTYSMNCTGGRPEGGTVISTIYQYEESGNGNWNDVSSMIYPRSDHALSTITLDQEMLTHCTSDGSRGSTILPRTIKMLLIFGMLFYK